jgi:hypothetical protein
MFQIVLSFVAVDWILVKFIILSFKEIVLLVVVLEMIIILVVFSIQFVFHLQMMPPFYKVLLLDVVIFQLVNNLFVLKDISKNQEIVHLYLKITTSQTIMLINVVLLGDFISFAFLTFHIQDFLIVARMEQVMQ